MGVESSLDIKLDRPFEPVLMFVCVPVLLNCGGFTSGSSDSRLVPLTYAYDRELSVPRYSRVLVARPLFAVQNGTVLSHRNGGGAGSRAASSIHNWCLSSERVVRQTATDFVHRGPDSTFPKSFGNTEHSWS